MKKALSIAIIIIGLLLVYILCNWYYTHKTNADSIDYVEQIDSIESALDDLQVKKDSTNSQIEAIVIKIKENSDKYEKVSNTIINNTPTDDYLFFSNYINSNKSRLDSLYNF
jgi:peptidoglycan hydrolase CwlO-like protein